MEDEHFVRRLCRKWKVPLVVEREDVAARSRQHGLSLEEAARIARYRFLARVARQRKLHTVVVAHHQQDQAETVLLKILQGCDRGHFRGMEMERSFPLLHWSKNKPMATRKKSAVGPGRLRLARPLLQSPLEEIVCYAKQNRLSFREDSSNRNLSTPRNWIRHRLILLMGQRLNRNVVKTLARFGE